MIPLLIFSIFYADQWAQPASGRRNKSEKMTQIRREDPVARKIYTKNGRKSHLVSMLFHMTSKLKSLFIRVRI